MSSNQDPGRVGKSGRQVGAENAERLRVYLDELKTEGRRLPSRGGKPDKSAIATAAGFSRLTLYNNPEAISLLDDAVNEIGLESADVAPITSGRALHLQQQLDRRDKRIQRLEELLASRTAEKEALARENKALKEELRRYSMMEEVITSSGRLFRP